MADEDPDSRDLSVSGDEGHSDPLSTSASVMLRYNGNKGSVLH